MKYFLFLAFGEHRFKKEALYSIFSLKQVLVNEKRVKIILYTDSPNFYTKYFQKYKNIIIEEITTVQIDKWIKDANYSFIVKIRIIQQCLHKYTGKILFVDSDVTFIKNPLFLFDNIGQNKFVMFMHCTSLGNALDKLHKFPNIPLAINRKYGYEKLIKGVSYFDKEFRLPQTFTPHNSGFIGIHSTNCNLVDEVESIVSNTFSEIQLVSLEEVAFSAVFQKYGGIITDVYSHNIAFHYMGQKYARLLVGYILKKLTEDDYVLLEAFIKEYQLNDLQSYNINMDNLQSFCAFLDILKSSQRYNTNEFELMSTYVKPDDITKDKSLFQQSISKFFRLFYRNKLLSNSNT